MSASFSLQNNTRPLQFITLSHVQLSQTWGSKQASCYHLIADNGASPQSQANSKPTFMMSREDSRRGCEAIERWLLCSKETLNFAKSLQFVDKDVVNDSQFYLLSFDR